VGGVAPPPPSPAPTDDVYFNPLPPLLLATLTRYERMLNVCSVAKFLVLDWGDMVDSGMGLSYPPAGLHRLASRQDNPMPESTIYPSQGLRVWPLCMKGAGG
jgi:hypothetical protein